jgi:hypothetical protein
VDRQGGIETKWWSAVVAGNAVSSSSGTTDPICFHVLVTTLTFVPPCSWVNHSDDDDQDYGSSRTKIASARLPNHTSTHETGAAVTYDDDSSDDDSSDDDNEEEEHIVPIRVDPDDSAATVMQK